MLKANYLRTVKNANSSLLELSDTFIVTKSTSYIMWITVMVIRYDNDTYDFVICSAIWKMIDGEIKIIYFWHETPDEEWIYYNNITALKSNLNWLGIDYAWAFDEIESLFTTNFDRAKDSRTDQEFEWYMKLCWL